MSSTLIDRRQVRQNFSCHAQDYDRYARVQKRVAAHLVELIRGQELPEGPVLEIGTGTGEAARNYLAQKPQANLVLSDIAHSMTAFASSQLRPATGVDCDAQFLPFRPASFGLVFSSSVFQWMTDLSSVFDDVARVLKPRGAFLFALYGERTLWELRHAHVLAHKEAGRVESSHTHRFPGESDVREALKGAGFVLERFFGADEVEYHPSVRALLKGLKKIGAQNASINRPRGLASRRIMERMIDLYTLEFAENGFIPATYHVIYALARQVR